MKHSLRRAKTHKVVGAAVAILLLASACADDDGGTADAPEDSEDGEDGEAAELVVDFWHIFGGDREEWINDTVAQYNEMTEGVTVVAENKAGYGELLDALYLAAGTDSVPAVAQVVVTSFGEALESGVFKSMTDIDTEGKINPDDYLESVMAQINIGGEMVSVPWANSTPILVYDKDMFESAGLDPEVPPATFEDLLAACEALVDEAQVVDSCIGIPWSQWFFENFIATQDAEIINNGNGRDDAATEAFLDSPEAVAAGEFYKDLYEGGYYVHHTEAWEFPRQQAAEAATAMNFTSTAELGFFTDTFAEQGRTLGAGYLPGPAGSDLIGTAIGGGSLWITGELDAATEQAALDFVLWVSSPEISAGWHKETGYLPIHREAATVLEQDGWFEENPNFKVAIDQLLDTEPVAATRVPLHTGYAEVQDAILTALEEIIVGHGDVNRALSEAAESGTASLERINEMTGG